MFVQNVQTTISLIKSLLGQVHLGLSDLLTHG